MKSLQFKSTPKGSRDPSPNSSSIEAWTEEKSEKHKDAEPKLDQRKELSSSSDSLSENKEKGGIFSGLFKKSPKTTEAQNEEDESLNRELSASTDSLSENKEKGGLFSGLLKKTPKTAEVDLSEKKSISTSNDSLSEGSKTKEKGNAFTGMFKKSKTFLDADTEEEKQPLDDGVSTSGSETSEGKEKGGIFGGIFKKAPKTTDEVLTDEENLDKELSGSSENLSEKKKEKGVFSGLLKKTPKADPSEGEEKKELRGSADDLSERGANKEKNIFSNIFKRQKALDEPEEKEASGDELSASNENLCENKQDKGMFGGLLKKTPKPPKERAASPEREDEEEAESGDQTGTTREKNKFTNLFKKPQKPAEGATAEKDENSEDLSGSSDNIFISVPPKEKKGGLAGMFKRSLSIDNLFDSEDNIFTGMFKKPNKNAEAKSADEDSLEDKSLSASCENVSGNAKAKEKAGGFAGMFKKPVKPAPLSATDEDPLSDAQYEFGSCDSIPDMMLEENLSASNEDLLTKEKKSGFAGLFKKTPKIVEPQNGEDEPPASGLGIKRRKTIKTKKRVVSFRIKKTLPKLPKLSQGADKLPVIGETVEMQELNTEQEAGVEVEQVEMAAYPTEENPMQEEDDELMDWWKGVVGWAEWNEVSTQEENEQAVMEEAADRVFMAARLFVHLFNQRGASLQHKILELLALADAADQFHKKTVSVAVGGGVASVCGSIATITGLILAPFTFGASIIVTAVGIGVATAGSITSATANITDTVHSNMDRKNMEKMIQGYQEEIKDIRECLEFVQEGIDALQEWDFEKFSESAAKKAMNHNIKHVVKEGGRAGKALMINTDKLISTVQVLGAAGGAAKAVQAISVTTGVMSALFLALDVFFLAKDSHELRKGAKTKFATKIREVCKDLQDGLLELNKVKTQLQKTMDGIEVEAYEEIQEVEVEVEDELESDPAKLAELDQELDLLEEKLDKKVEEEKKKREEEEGRKKKEEEERKMKEEEAKAAKEKLLEETEGAEDEEKELKKVDVKKIKSEKETKKLEEEKSEGVYSVKESIKDFFKDPILKVTKKDKDTENKITADKEKGEKDKSILGKKTHKKEASLSGNELLGGTEEEEKLEKGKSKKRDDKVKVKSQKEVLTTKQDAKAEEKPTTPHDGKSLAEEKEEATATKKEEKSHFKSLRESWLAKQENAEEKVHSKSVKEVVKPETNEDQRVKSLRESWLAKEDLWAKTDEKAATPKESRKVLAQEEKLKAESPSLSSRTTGSTSKSHHSRKGSSGGSSSSGSSRRKLEHKNEEEKESPRHHHGDGRERLDRSGRVEAEQQSRAESKGEKPRSVFERGDEAERGGSRRNHRESGRGHAEDGRSHVESARSHRDREKAGDGESRRSHREKDAESQSGRSKHDDKDAAVAPKDPKGSRSDLDVEGRSGHRESGRSHRDQERESRRSHKDGERRREHGGSRPRSNAVLDDGLYI
ncbi:uncharacterized protein [Eucyclogobius newberryi]|uniref:uncharacterized protein n=1 Tax=Eucyclogobius newberryi TaxID=166745 RepID=UPI003B5AD852